MILTETYQKAKYGQTKEERDEAVRALVKEVLKKPFRCANM